MRCERRKDTTIAATQTLTNNTLSVLLLIQLDGLVVHAFDQGQVLFQKRAAHCGWVVDDALTTPKK